MNTLTLFEHLIDLSIKATAVLTLAYLALWLLRRASAASRHFIWGTTFVSLLLLPILSGLLPQWTALPSWQRATAPLEVVVAKPSDPSQAAPRTGITISPAPVSAASEEPVSARPIIVQSRSVDAMAPSRRSWQRWALIAWAVVSLLLLSRLALCFRRLARLRRHITPVREGERIQALLQDACDQLGIDRRRVTLALRRHPGAVPMVFGVGRHHLILPLEAGHWSDDRLQAVFFHELAHVKRRDAAMEWIVQGLCALYWFHPLVWHAARQLRHERERACDDLVLARGIPSPNYAEHLLQILTRSSAPHNAPALAMADPGRLESRMVSILGDHMVRTPVSPSLRWLSLGACLALTIPLALLQAAPQKEGGVTYQLKGLDAARVHRYLDQHFGESAQLEVDTEANSVHVTSDDSAIQERIEALFEAFESQNESPRATESPDSAEAEAAALRRRLKDKLMDLLLEEQRLIGSSLGKQHPERKAVEAKLSQLRQVLEDTARYHAQQSAPGDEFTQRYPGKNGLLQLYQRYQDILDSRDELTQSGLGARHPQVRSKDHEIEFLKSLLDNAARNDQAAPSSQLNLARLLLEEQRSPANVELIVTLDHKGDLWLGDSKISIDQIRGRFTRVQVQADPQVPFKLVSQILSQLKENAGITDIRIQSTKPSGL